MNDAVTPHLKPRSDLGIRTFSGVVMMGVAIVAIWYGGNAFVALVAVVGLGVLWEFSTLVLGFAQGVILRSIWLVGGLVYVGLACFTLLLLSSPFLGTIAGALLIAGVIGTDIGAYFVGRSIGGPKIAPTISPSKTWSGLLGGMIGAGVVMMAAQAVMNWGQMNSGHTMAYSWASLAFIGAIIAVIAQTGDFFESWMKRRAGVKDSGRLIPGHGGLFDRTDGLIAVAFVAGVILIIQIQFYG